MNKSINLNAKRVAASHYLLAGNLSLLTKTSSFRVGKDRLMCMTTLWASLSSLIQQGRIVTVRSNRVGLAILLAL